MAQNNTGKHRANHCNTLEDDSHNIRCRNWIITLNNYTNENLTQIELLTNCQWIYQPEIGESGTPHIQGCLLFDNPRSFKAMKKKFPTAHLEICENKYKCINYCRKKLTRAGNTRTNMDLDKIFGKRKEIKDYFIHKPYKWQSDIIKLIHTEPDERTVNWYWETTGGVGKSSLTRHLILKYGALAVMGGARDILCGVTNWINNGKELKTIIIDIPRCQSENVSYKAIEQLKNGFFFNTKYESGMIIFNIPHVIVFANFKPVIDRLSKDRWNIVSI